MNLRSDALASILAALGATAVTGFVYWFGNGSLYLSHWNAQLIATIREAQWQISRDSVGAFWSPLEGFGQRSLESPTWLSPSYFHMIFTGGSFSEPLFAVTIGSMTFVSTLWLAKKLGSGTATSILSASFTLFVVFLPSPFAWQRQAGQSGVLIGLPTLFSSALALAIASYAKRRTQILNVIFFALTVSVSAYALGTASPLLLIPLLVVWPSIVLRRAINDPRERVLALLKCVVLFVAVVPVVIAQYAFIVLHRQADQIAPGPRTYVDLLTSFWGDLGAVYPWYRWMVIAGVVGVIAAGWALRAARPFALAASVAFGLALFVSVLGVFAVRAGWREVLPSSNYFIIALTPLIASSMFGIMQHLVGGVTARYTRVPQFPSALVVSGVMTLLLATWALAWSFNNRDLRVASVSLERARTETDAITGPIISDLDCSILDRLENENMTSFCGRVILIDSETQTIESEPRRDPLWVASLYEALTLHGVPVVNSYASRYSGPFYKFTNKAFSDGSQSIRAWVVYNEFNPAVARLFGVRVVIADRPLDGLELVRRFPHVDGNGVTHQLFHYRLDGSNQNGFSVSKIAQVADISSVVEGLSSPNADMARAFSIGDSGVSGAKLVTPESFAMRLGASQIALRGTTSGESLVLLPFEFSNCLSVSAKHGSEARLVRLNGIQLAVWFRGSLDVSVQLTDTGLGLRSCWNQDHLPERAMD